DPGGSRFSTEVLARVRGVRRSGHALDGGGRTVLLVAGQSVGSRIALLAAGDRVRVRGALGPLRGPYEEHLGWRHAIGRVDATDLLDFTPAPGLLALVANA